MAPRGVKTFVTSTALTALDLVYQRLRAWPEDCMARVSCTWTSEEATTECCAGSLRRRGRNSSRSSKLRRAHCRGTCGGSWTGTSGAGICRKGSPGCGVATAMPTASCPGRAKGEASARVASGRRMAERAAFWVDHVLPEVGIRQWVLTVPWRVRWLLARHPHLVRGVVGIAWRAVFAYQARRAAAAGHTGGRCGAVTAIQRFGSALNLNVHAHGLLLDGVYVEEGEELRFVRLPPPTTEEVEELVVTVAARCERWLRSQGFGDEELSEQPEEDTDGLSEVQAASVGGRSVLGRVRRVQRLGGKLYRLPPRCASSFGYTLHAGVAVGPRDRQGLERLARYLCRPPLAKARLSRGPDGEVVLGLKRAWSDGTTELRFTPLAFLERLVALVPPPRAHQTLYHGVLARRSAWRSRVVPEPAEPRKRGPTLCATHRPASRWVPWADLLLRVFEQDGFACPVCRHRNAPQGARSGASGHADGPPRPETVRAAGPRPTDDPALRCVAAPRDAARSGASRRHGPPQISGSGAPFWTACHTILRASAPGSTPEPPCTTTQMSRGRTRRRLSSAVRVGAEIDEQRHRDALGLLAQVRQ